LLGLPPAAGWGMESIYFVRTVHGFLACQSVGFEEFGVFFDRRFPTPIASKNCQKKFNI
jgi:hypothetical protein